MRKYLTIGVLALVLAVVLLFGLPFADTSFQTSTDIYISEVMISNNILYAEDGKSHDWIELHNPSELQINLRGYGLSDDSKEPFKWQFPNVFIGPDEYLIVWASGNNLNTNTTLHASFSIKSGKEPIILTAPDETTLTELTPESADSSYSYGYHQNLNRNVWFPYPTPGKANGMFYVEKANRNSTPDAPVLSHYTGFYNEGFELELSTANDAVIYYTLDGSIPDESSYIYEGPIKIDPSINPNNYADFLNISYMTQSSNIWGRPSGSVFKVPVLRTIAYEEGKGVSDTITATYFIDHDMEERYSLPIVSIVTDPANLFDYDKGIYVTGRIFDETDTKMAGDMIAGDTPANYTQRGSAWERPANLSFISSNGTMLFSQDIGVRIHGAWSRANPQKGLKLLSDEKYGNDTMDYPFFEGLNGTGNNTQIDSFRRLLVRAHGNDWSFALCRDPLIQHIADVSPVIYGLDTQATTPTIVFLNGEYWGVYNIRETLDEFKLGSHYGIEPEEISIIEMKNGEYLHGTGSADSTDDYVNLMAFVDSNDLNKPEAFAYVASQVDLNNFIFYMATQTYFANTDWPGNNIRIWRKEVDEMSPYTSYGHDGRWRYILYDTDFGFNIYEHMQNNAQFNSLAFAAEPYGPHWPNPPNSTVLFRNLLDSTNFKNEFIVSYCNLLNTSFDASFVTENIELFAATLYPEIDEHHSRYNHLANWFNEVKKMKTFAVERHMAMWGILREEYDLGETVSIELSVNDGSKGTIIMNNFEPLEWSSPYQGKYFEEIPITLTAIPEEGYTFVGWENMASKETAISVIPEEDLTITALFE